MAVATNFRAAAEQLKIAYEAEHNAKVLLTAGSTGKLYTQILNGAPYALFLAADKQRPKLLVDQGIAKPDTHKTYALGALTLISNHTVNANTFAKNQFRSLAIANPKLAPYGVAAVETLKHLDVFSTVVPKLVTAENVGQAYAMVATGNADLGLVASALVPEQSDLFHWRVPTDHYTPIRQDLVVIDDNNSVAEDFAAFILSAEGRHLIRAAGFRVPTH